MEPIYLSLEEAQKLVPVIKKDLLKLMRINKTLSLLNSVEIEYDDEYKTLIHKTMFSRRYHKLSYEFYSLLERLHNRGCVVTEVDKGLVDFYSFFEGREIFLCWKISEKKIKYWHEINVGFDSRKPVSMIEKKLQNKE
ncbi:DUF2203 domain-containing protein [Candidatus Woesearchaeota archaeon]|nr:DUF2203 domain-containing protein [Candidatus Woesearchaeota archaeon]